MKREKISKEKSKKIHEFLLNGLNPNEISKLENVSVNKIMKIIDEEMSKVEEQWDIKN